MTHKIDLLNADREPQPIALQWTVNLDDYVSRGFLGGLFGGDDKPTEFEAVVSADEPDACLTLDKNEPLLLFRYGGQETVATEPLTFTGSGTDCPFELLLNTKAVTGSTDGEGDQTYGIPLSIEVKRKSDGKGVFAEKLTADVQFLPVDVKPTVRFAIDHNLRSVTYNSQLGQRCVGKLVGYIDLRDSRKQPIAIGRAPRVTVSLRVRAFVDGEQVDGLAYFVNHSQQPTANIALEDLTATLNEKGKPTFREVPVYVDFSLLRNPKTAQQTITIEADPAASSFFRSNNPVEPLSFDCKPGQLTLLKNDVVTRLEIKAEGKALEENPSVIQGGAGSLQTRTVEFVPQGGFMEPVTLTFRNISDDATSYPGAALHIRRLKLSEIVPEVRLIDADDRIVERVIVVKGDELRQLQSDRGLAIPNGIDAQTVVEVNFDPSAIVEVRGATDYNVTVHSVVQFEYLENKEGRSLHQLEGEWKPGEVRLDWHLHQAPYPEWLCVDYGSSAIVCMYNGKIIDLKQQKDLIYQRDRGYEQLRADDYERGTQFLASDVVLHRTSADAERPLSSLCSEQDEREPYSSLAVCLSPTSSQCRQEFRLLLPCLKVLVGNEFLPEKDEYAGFQYSCLDPVSHAVRTVTAKETRRQLKSLMRVATVFEESYRALFRYFIAPAPQIGGNMRRINRLVLTYPNTYTPVHLNIIRDIAVNTFPCLRLDDGGLRFVSESDAVAAYYVEHWNEFKHKTLHDLNDEEYVLVYDMGAGTLDITYLHKYVNPLTGKIIVDILGKLGSSKAGNYLDFVLADLVSRHPDVNLDPNIASTSSKFLSAATIQRRIELKEQVRDNIKLNFSLSPPLRFTIGGKQYEIPSEDVEESEEVERYLTECTRGIVDLLCQYMNSSRLRIDSVLLSGRSSKLNSLRPMLMKAVKAIVTDGCTPDLVQMGNQKSQLQKTVVVDGATLKVQKFDGSDSTVTINSRRLYANYGVAYTTLGGHMRYQELIGHNYIPDSREKGTYKAPPVQLADTANADTLSLIQTYLSQEETERQLNERRRQQFEEEEVKDFDFITVMQDYDIREFGNPSTLTAQLLIEPSCDIVLKVEGRPTHGNAPRGANLNSEVTRRSLWPVTF